MNQIVFLDKKEFKIQKQIDDNQEYNLFLIDFFLGDSTLNIDLNLKNKCKVKIIISIINKNNFNKNYFININHSGNNSISCCEAYCIASGTSNSKINFLAKIDGKSVGNNCEQKIKGIMISKEAKVEGLPNLIIDTNNVNAKHALAIGKLNIDHLFYLMSKGINKQNAIQLLLLSYFDAVLSEIQDKTKKDQITNHILNQIGNIDI